MLFASLLDSQIGVFDRLRHFHKAIHVFFNCLRHFYIAMEVFCIVYVTIRQPYMVFLSFGSLS